MDTVLRQSKTMCPFLKKTSPATLRSLSATSGPTRSYHASPGGGSMSNLQTIARRCPVMGSAMAVQSAKTGGNVAFGAIAALKGIRGFSGKASTGKAKLHTSSAHEARPMEGILMGEKRESIPRHISLQIITDTSKSPRSSQPSQSRRLPPYQRTW